MKKKTYEELEQRINTLEKEVFQLNKTKDELRKTNEIFNLFMEHNPIYTFLKDKDLRSIKLSRNYEQMLERPIDEILGKTMDEIFPSDLAKSMTADDLSILEKREPIKVEEELNGRFYETFKFPIIMDDKPEYLAGYTIDITERKRTEDALKQSLIKYEKTFQSAPVWVTLTTFDEGRCIEVNESFLKDTGFEREEVIGRTAQELDIWVDEKARESIVSQIRKVGRINSMDIQWKKKNGEIIDALFSAELLNLEDQDVLISVTQNITTLKQTQKDLEYLKNQLLHSQKMESIGRLAGGVAHDYNNMLTVITGNSEIALLKVDEDSSIYDNLQEILNAAERSSNITKQLLAFARKQAIEPRILDINDTLSNMLNMLKRLIGEDIELIWKPKRNIWPVKMDPSQIDQILVNLCVNSRDAIEYLGEIIIQTDNIVVGENNYPRYPGLKIGDYVLLKFSDNGKGIDEGSLENIFEPFFTTKDVGKGTGLGLSTVYGIVKQNNGYINVKSVPDEGTTFKIFIPRHKMGKRTEDVKHGDQIFETQGETILIVEDDASVKKVCETILRDIGYNILSIDNPGDALKTAKEYPEQIHLLLSDVVMPEMTGRDMARKIKKIRPDIKILFMSGYTSDSILHEGLIYEGLNFLKKPFSTNSLAIKVREILDEGNE